MYYSTPVINYYINNNVQSISFITYRHFGGWPDHIPPPRHSRFSEPNKTKSGLQVYVASVPTLKVGIISNIYVIAPFGMGASAGHGPVKERKECATQLIIITRTLCTVARIQQQIMILKQ